MGRIRLALAVLAVIAAVAGLASVLPANARAAFPGRNGRILFLHEVPGPQPICSDPLGPCEPLSYFEIRSARPDGSHSRRLTSGHYDRSPSYSPDGRRIVFSRDGPGFKAEEIWLMRADGSHPRKLTDSGGVRPPRSTAPSFSPSGRRVAFASAGGVVSVRTRDGKGRRVLFRSTNEIMFLSWSVRDVLAVAEDCRGIVGLWRASTRKIRSRRLVRGDCVDAFPGNFTWYPNWSPSGRRLAYMHRTWYHHPPTTYVDRIFLKRLSHRPRPYGHGDRDTAPVFSPNGRSLAFNRLTRFEGSPYDGDIRVARLGRGSRSTALTGQLADWQPLPRRRHH